MSRYRYQARGADGRPLTGEIEAGNPGAAAAQLSMRGMTPIEIRELSTTGAGLVGAGLWGSRVPLEQLVMFCRQMRTLTHAGVPLIRALTGLAQTARHPALARALRQTTDALRSGRSLTDALEAHPRVFSKLFVATVHMGESSGRLEETFEELGRYLEREQETIRSIRSATRYPLLVIMAVIAAIAVINLFVIPAFSNVFASHGAELPWATRLLIASSDFFVAYWLHVAVAGIAVAVALRSWLGTEGGRLLWHRYQLRLPIIGSILERATLARFARGFAITSASGVPIIAALKSVAAAVDNAWVCERILSMRERIAHGASLCTAAEASGLFLPLVLQMIAVGEESGSVEPLLAEVAEYYEGEVEYDLKRLSDAIEPLLIVGLGVLVLILALGVYLPLWDLAQVAHG
ncbi:MAG: type II secretion system F family protein [Myxococcota bacterium]